MPKAGTRPAPIAASDGDENIHAHRAELVDIDALQYDPENAKLHPEGSIDAIKQSLTDYGQRKPVVVNRRTQVVEAGNGTLEAARALGWRKIAVVFVDDDDVTATGYGLADNLTAERSKWDYETLNRLILLRDGLGLTTAGMSSAQIVALRLQMEADEKPPTVIFPEERIIDTCFDHFRKTGFPYNPLPLHACMQEINALANADADTLRETPIGIAVADTFHPHRWHAAAEDKRTPFETFSNDEWFRTAIRKTIEMGGKVGKRFVEGLRYSQGTQACANFRPGFALLYIKRFCPPGGVMLDTSIGYGGRLVGFMASGIKGYIGIDPSSDSIRGNTAMVEALGFKSRARLIQKPAEDVPEKELMGKCDFAFTSPPYFRKEHYSDELTQSWRRYQDGESWRVGFLLPMMRLQYAALRPGSVSVVNISDVKIKGQTYPLAAWTVDAAKRMGFAHVGTEDYPLGRVPGAKGAETTGEPVLIFKRK